MPGRTQLWAWMQSSFTKHTEALQHRAYINSLLQNLRDHSQTIGHEALLQERIHELYQEAMERHRTLIVDSRSGTHLQVACLVESSYKTLLPWFCNDQDKVIDLIRKPLGESASGILGISQKIALLLSFDKFSFMSRSLKYMDLDFGSSFVFVHDIKPKYHRLSVRRCLYHTVFTKDGVPELTHIFCALDRMWFDQVHPKAHGITFSRCSTLADGNESCEFVIEKT